MNEEQWQIFDPRGGNHVREFIARLAEGALRKWGKCIWTF